MAKWANEENKKVVYFMVGLPCSGKSTYIAKHFDLSQIEVLSFDDKLQEVAEENGKTYNDIIMGDAICKEANKRYKQRKNDLFQNGKSPIIVDQTNVYISARSKLCDFAKKHGYEVVYFVFRKPENSKQANEWLKRIENRKEKFVPEEGILTMYSNYVYPDFNVEDVDKVINIKNAY